MSKFDNHGHISSWAGVSPGQKESAGKKKPARSPKGNPHVKRILCEIAWVVSRMRNTYLSQWYWKVRARRGTKKALIGLARRILIIIYSSLKSGCLYSEEIIAKKPVAQIERRKQSLIRELKRLGVQVQLVEQNTTMPASA